MWRKVVLLLTGRITIVGLAHGDGYDRGYDKGYAKGHRDILGTSTLDLISKPSRIFGKDGIGVTLRLPMHKG